MILTACTIDCALNTDHQEKTVRTWTVTGKGHHATLSYQMSWRTCKYRQMAVSLATQAVHLHPYGYHPFIRHMNTLSLSTSKNLQGCRHQIASIGSKRYRTVFPAVHIYHCPLAAEQYTSVDFKIPQLLPPVLSLTSLGAHRTQLLSTAHPFAKTY